MGNLCLVSDERINYVNNKVICYKCGDKFYTDSGGTYSHRKSCRYHDFNDKGVCKNCHLSETESVKCCYHIKKLNWYSSFLNG